MTIRTLALVPLALLGFAAAAMPAFAATAHATNNIQIFDVPRDDQTQVAGVLRAGEDVTLDTCTPDGIWCRVIHDGPPGWVLASFLVGAQAKVDATVSQGGLTNSTFSSNAGLGPVHRN